MTILCGFYLPNRFKCPTCYCEMVATDVLELVLWRETTPSLGEMWLVKSWIFSFSRKITILFLTEEISRLYSGVRYGKEISFVVSPTIFFESSTVSFPPFNLQFVQSCDAANKARVIVVLEPVLRTLVFIISLKKCFVRQCLNISLYFSTWLLISFP